jgi:hypothetical protein
MCLKSAFQMHAYLEAHAADTLRVTGVRVDISIRSGAGAGPTGGRSAPHGRVRAHRRRRRWIASRRVAGWRC